MDIEESKIVNENHLKYINDIKSQVNLLNENDKEQLKNYLKDLGHYTFQGRITIEYIKRYIKEHSEQNEILFIAFKTRDINKLAHVCKYIIFSQWANGWTIF